MSSRTHTSTDSTDLIITIIIIIIIICDLNNITFRSDEQYLYVAFCVTWIKLIADNLIGGVITSPRSFRKMGSTVGRLPSTLT